MISLVGLGDDTAAQPSLLPDGAQPSPMRLPWLAYLATASAAVSGFHGYRRNKSIGWALVWFLLGGLFPVIVPTIAFAEGYAQPKKVA